MALACSDGVFGLTELIPGGLRWVAPMATQPNGVTRVEVLFADLKPVIRARPVALPMRFDGSAINRLQVLHSRFDEGETPIKDFVLVRSGFCCVRSKRSD